mmetsp:Transcript_23883/g.80168  ORF Transcript_23883/g.80168 Transcript_23883/m.80168 type:complete len:281 (-) Transcript_23883:170-1012(-)
MPWSATRSHRWPFASLRWHAQRRPDESMEFHMHKVDPAWAELSHTMDPARLVEVQRVASHLARRSAACHARCRCKDRPGCARGAGHGAVAPPAQKRARTRPTSPMCCARGTQRLRRRRRPMTVTAAAMAAPRMSDSLGTMDATEATSSACVGGPHAPWSRSQLFSASAPRRSASTNASSSPIGSMTTSAGMPLRRFLSPYFLFSMPAQTRWRRLSSGPRWLPNGIWRALSDSQVLAWESASWSVLTRMSCTGLPAASASLQKAARLGSKVTHCPHHVAEK